MHRRFTVGDLATLHVLDTRQYRTAPPCGDGWRTCLDARHPKRSLLGEAQESWLFAGLADSRTRWNVLAQQVMMMQLTRKSEDGNGLELHTDRWDGAPAGRDRLFDVIEQRRLPGMVTLTGDIHSNWAGDLKRDFASERSATLGVEFVATSIASGGDGSDGRSRLAAVRSANPHIKFFNNQRGYVRHTVRRDHWQADFRVLASVRQPDALVATRQSLTTLRDRPGVQPS
jgi:alkaline phosphatase D